MPPNIDEVVRDLHVYRETGCPVALEWHSEERGTPFGYVSAVEDDYFIFARIYQIAWINGYDAARFTEIKEVVPLPDDDREFLAKAMEAQGVLIPPVLPLRAATLADLLANICDDFPMVVINTRHEDEQDDVGGTILSVAGETARMRLLSNRGDWLDDIHEVEIPQVTEVFFGSNYERVLERIGLFLDGPRVETFD